VPTLCFLALSPLIILSSIFMHHSRISQRAQFINTASCGGVLASLVFALRSIPVAIGVSVDSMFPGSTARCNDVFPLLSFAQKHIFHRCFFGFIKKYLTSIKSTARIECEGRGERHVKKYSLFYISRAHYQTSI
jgi:hypothetical protein